MMRHCRSRALALETPLALWNDIQRCPITVGDLVFNIDRLYAVVDKMPMDSHHPDGWWLIVNDEEIMTGIGFMPYNLRPHQNVTVRHRLERAVRTVQRRWRARRLARVLVCSVGHRLNSEVCDVIAGHAVGASRPGAFF